MTWVIFGKWSLQKLKFLHQSEVHDCQRVVLCPQGDQSTILPQNQTHDALNRRFIPTTGVPPPEIN